MDARHPMYERARRHAVAQVAAERPELAALLEGQDSWTLPIMFAPDLVRLLCSSESPAELSRIVLEFMSGLQVLTQVRYDEMAGAGP